MLTNPASLTLSVVTPSYNQADFLERTINSVLAQQIPNLEYLVYDGGSTDRSIDILERYSASLSWRSKPDEGQADAVNQAMQHSSGDIIGWLNSDDIYYPNALRTVLSFFADNPTVDVIYGEANHIDSQDAVIDRYYTEDWQFERLKEICFLCQPATFFRRRVIEQQGLLNSRLNYCMDYEFWLRLGRNGVNFARIPQLLAGSRLHGNTKTLGEKINVHKEINAMLKNMFGKVPDRWISNYAYAIADKITSRTSRLSPLLVTINVLYASLKWNHRLPNKLLAWLPLKSIVNKPSFIKQNRDGK